MGIVEQKLRGCYYLALLAAYNELRVYYGCLAHNNQERSAVGLQMAWMKNILTGFNEGDDLSAIGVREMYIAPKEDGEE